MFTKCYYSTAYSTHSCRNMEWASNSKMGTASWDNFMKKILKTLRKQPDIEVKMLIIWQKGNKVFLRDYILSFSIFNSILWGQRFFDTPYLNILWSIANFSLQNSNLQLYVDIIHNDLLVSVNTWTHSLERTRASKNKR